MKRIERFKNKLDKTCTETQNKKRLSLDFQEMVNLLPTYDEKKELSDHFDELSKELQVANN